MMKTLAINVAVFLAQNEGPRLIAYIGVGVVIVSGSLLVNYFLAKKRNRAGNK